MTFSTGFLADGFMVSALLQTSAIVAVIAELLAFPRQQLFRLRIVRIMTFCAIACSYRAVENFEFSPEIIVTLVTKPRFFIDHFSVSHILVAV